MEALSKDSNSPRLIAECLINPVALMKLCSVSFSLDQPLSLTTTRFPISGGVMWGLGHRLWLGAVVSTAHGLKGLPGIFQACDSLKYLLTVVQGLWVTGSVPVGNHCFTAFGEPGERGPARFYQVS